LAFHGARVGTSCGFSQQITTNGVGISVQIQNNSVRGSGPNPNIAQNGIQLGFGATGDVEDNALSDFVYSGEGFVATGILVVGSHGADIQENVVGNTQGGIATVSIPGSDANKTNISDNWIFGTVSTNDGIYVCSNRNQVQGNTIHNSTEAGVNLDSSCGGGATTIRSRATL
jgi:Right handed beta helix region